MGLMVDEITNGVYGRPVMKNKVILMFHPSLGDNRVKWMQSDVSYM